MPQVSGEDILYRAFDDLIRSDHEAVIQVLMPYAIFLDPDLVRRFPVLKPGVIRDARRKLKFDSFGRTDDWGRADPNGYIRDDNSLLKPIPRSLNIISEVPHLTAKRLGTGWVASHIWRRTKSLERANADPWLNSFGPNMVWLPKQVSKLSDREGSIFQSALKIASLTLYANLDYESPRMREMADYCWGELEPAADFTFRPVGSSFFETSDKWIQRTEQRMRFLHDGARTGDIALLKRGGVPSNFFESQGFGSETFLDGLVKATSHLSF